MNVRILMFLCSCLGSFPVVGFDEGSPMPVEVGASDYSALMRRLPWDFRQTSRSIATEEDGARAQTRYDFVSAEPVRTQAQRALHLRAELTVSEFSEDGIAESRWRALQEKAHPDMGLSYAWDYLIFRGQTIYHLHAACTFSDRSFDTMVVNLNSMLSYREKEAAQTIRCNCGGGCRSGVVMQSIDNDGVPR